MRSKNNIFFLNSTPFFIVTASAISEFGGIGVLQHDATTTTPSEFLTIANTPDVPSSFCLAASVLSLYHPGGGKVHHTFEIGTRQSWLCTCISITSELLYCWTACMHVSNSQPGLAL